MSTISKEIKENIKPFSNCKNAEIIGKHIAVKSKQKGFTKIVFDRGNNLYHGKVKALAEAARQEGIDF